MALAESSHNTVAYSDEAIDRLIAGLRTQDPEAQAALLAQYGPPIQEFAARRLGEEELAKDVMVQTLVDSICDIGRFNPRISSFRAWLFGIARRRIQQEARLRARRRLVPSAAQVSLERVAEEAAKGDLATSMSAKVDAQRQAAELEAHLSPQEMEVLLLRCVHELSLREIAHVVGRSERAINSLLDRAKQKARDLLASGELVRLRRKGR